MKTKKFFCIIGMIAGAFLSFLGICLASGNTSGMFHYDYPDDVEFGGDFYTEQYAATRAAAKNIAMVGSMFLQTVKYFGLATICFGAITVSHFSIKFVDDKNKSRSEFNNLKSSSLSNIPTSDTEIPFKKE